MFNQIHFFRYLFIIISFSFIHTFNLFSQDFQEEVLLLKERNITLSEAINTALQNNPIAKNAELKVQAANLIKGSAIEFGGTEVSYHYGQINSAFNDQYFKVNQSLGSPFAQIQKKKVVEQQFKLSEAEQQMVIRDLIMRVKTAWFRWLFSLEDFLLAESESLIYTENLEIAQQRKEFIDTVSLEQSLMETRFAEIQNNQYQAAENFKLATNDMKALLFVNDNIFPADTVLEMYAIDVQTVGVGKFVPSNFVSYYKGIINLKDAEVTYEKTKLFPEVAVGYFNQEIDHVKGFQGVSLDMYVPIWFLPQKNKIKESKIESAIARNEFEYQQFTLQREIENLRIKLDQLFVQISFYRENALKQAGLLKENSLERYKKGTINYMSFMQNINTAYTIRHNYYEKLMLYNLTAIKLEYYIK